MLMMFGIACMICSLATGLLLICLDHDWGAILIAVGMVLGIVLAAAGGAL